MDTLYGNKAIHQVLIFMKIFESKPQNILHQKQKGSQVCQLALIYVHLSLKRYTLS